MCCRNFQLTIIYSTIVINKRFSKSVGLIHNTRGTKININVESFNSNKINVLVKLNKYKYKLFIMLYILYLFCMK